MTTCIAAPPGLLRYTGRMDALTAADRRALLSRASDEDAGIRATTARIIADVRARGDTALLELARELDGVTLDALEVPRRAMAGAVAGLDPALRRALERAAANIGSVHRAFLPQPVEARPEPGVVVGRRPDPLARVGIYAPGGRAAYPSSVLMAAIPARVAGVPEVILASPPRRDGLPAASVLAAAAIAQVDRVFAIGGAGAIAAMALGTRSVPRVDRVVGPGNAYVAAAKVALSSEVGIDCVAGPSELLVIADHSAEPGRVADEMIAQAEHDPRACVVAIAVATGPDDQDGGLLAQRIVAAIGARIPDTPRRTIVEASLRARGAVLVARDLDQAVALANDLAPEHLMLATRDDMGVLARVRGAGTVFIGTRASVAFGDYLTGANHVLPTGGTARWASGLSPLDFMRWTTWQRVTPEAARSLAADVELLAATEGLPGHAAAAASAAWTMTAAPAVSRAGVASP